MNNDHMKSTNITNTSNTSNTSNTVGNANTQYIVIMAGGSGTRMNSSLPKQLHNVGTDPMMVHLLRQASELSKHVILIVSAKNRDIIINTLTAGKYITPIVNDGLFKFQNILVHLCVQPVANGTGGALMATSDMLKSLDPNDQLVVLSADVPLITAKTIIDMFNKISNYNTNAVILAKDTKNTSDNFGYGRVVCEDNQFDRIVEQKDCKTDRELNETLINTGVYAFKVGPLLESFKHLDQNNSQKEYYLTDCPKFIKEQYGGSSIQVSVTNNDQFDETMGANTPQQLEILRSEFLKKFSIEDVHDSVSNTSDRNISHLIDVLNQLTTVNTNNVKKVREYIESLNTANLNRKYMLVVKYEDIIVGTGSIIIEEKIAHNFGKVGHIEDIVIDSKYRGLNLARKLVEKLIDVGKDHNCYKIILDAATDVKGFYEKIGFKVHSNNMRLNL